jgi:hypothetical protein
VRSKLHLLKPANGVPAKAILAEQPLKQGLTKIEEAKPKPPPKIKFSAHPVALNPELTKARPTFEKVLLEAPAAAVELQLFYSKGENVSSQQIEARITSLQNPGNRSVRALYKRYAVAYLQEELRKRG